MTIKQILLLAAVVVLIGAFFYFGFHHHLTLENFKAQRQIVIDFYHARPFLTILGFGLFYVAVTGLSLPGATILTIIAGAIFDLALGTIVVSFASTIGASLAFLLARYLFRNLIEAKFSKLLKPINSGIEKDGNFYLFALRLVPLFPFFAVNVAMALTKIRLWPFFWVSQVGMFAGTIVYVNAGSQLGQLESLSGILSPALIASFVLLGLFPLISKKGLELYKTKFRNPRSV